MSWYIAESRERVIRLPTRISYGVPCEGYETPVAGQVYMHVVELSDDDVGRLRHRVEDGRTREQLAFYGEERWYFPKNGKCRWPGRRLQGKARKDSDGKWKPMPVDDAVAVELVRETTRAAGTDK